MADSTCLLCGGTGVDVFFRPCAACANKAQGTNPIAIKVPKAYQNITDFDKSFLPNNISSNYGDFMQDIYEQFKASCTFNSNLIICSPPNSGKSILAYSIYNILNSKGIKFLPLLDLMEANDLMMSFTKDKSDLVIFEKCPIVFVILPMALPFRFVETIGNIVQRRVRHGGGTIFLYRGSRDDLEAYDKYNKLRLIEGDGSYSSVKIADFRKYYKE